MAHYIKLRFSDDLPALPSARRLEQLARADRLALRCRFGEPCDPRRLIELYDVRQVLETYPDYQAHFGRDMSDAFSGLRWSGALLNVGNNDHLILVNPEHSDARRALTIGHEFGHLACGHRPITFVENGGLIQTRYSDEQELEAFGYGLAVLIPYAPLVQMLQQGASLPAIAHHYQVSVAAVRMRVNLTSLNGVCLL